MNIDRDLLLMIYGSLIGIGASIITSILKSIFDYWLSAKERNRIRRENKKARDEDEQEKRNQIILPTNQEILDIQKEHLINKGLKEKSESEIQVLSSAEEKRSTVVKVSIIMTIAIILFLIGGNAQYTVREGHLAEQRVMITQYSLETKVAQRENEIEILAAQIGNASPTFPPVVEKGQLRGVLTDRQGKPLSNMIISLQPEFETITDSVGSFLLNNVPIGNQTITVVSPSSNRSYDQNVFIEENQTTDVGLVLDIQSMQLGLLSIVTPVDGTNIETVAGDPIRLIIKGRSDGLAQIFGGYDKFSIWVLVRAIKDDNRLWI